MNEIPHLPSFEDDMSESKSSNLTWHGALLSTEKREQLLGQKGCVLWFTGLSGSGKSTVARALEQRIVQASSQAYVLDGDNLRLGLNADLTFKPEDRKENIRRVGELAKLFADSGVICLTAFISPYRADRDRIREILPSGRFFEIHVATPLEICESRDPKGLYKKARTGDINNFTGISAPYEAPIRPDLVVNSPGMDLNDSVDALWNLLKEKQIF